MIFCSWDYTVIIHIFENVFFITVFVSLSSCFAILVHSCKRVKGFRAFRDSCKTSTFRNCEFWNVLSEILLGSHLDTVGSTAETDIVKICFKNFILRIFLFKLHSSENFSDFSFCCLFIIARDVLYKLLCNGRTTLIWWIEMQEHICKCCKSTLVINAFMRIKSFIFGVYKCISCVFRYSVDAYRNTLVFGFYMGEFKQIAWIRVICIDKCGVIRFEVMDTYFIRILHEFKHIYRKSRCNNRSCQNYDEKQWKQHCTDNGKEFFQSPEFWFFLRLFLARSLVRIFAHSFFIIFRCENSQKYSFLFLCYISLSQNTIIWSNPYSLLYHIFFSVLSLFFNLIKQWIKKVFLVNMKL